MKNSTRRMQRAAKRALAKLECGFGTVDKPLVLTRDNVSDFITALAPCVYRNPKTEKYRDSQKKRMGRLP